MAYKKLLLLFLLFAPCVLAQKSIITSVCFQDSTATCLANGSITFRLNMGAKVISNGQVVNAVNIPFTLTSGGMTPVGAALYGNDQLQATGTVYIVNIYNSNGLLVRGPENWILSGASPIDLSLETNVNLPDPGLRNPEMQNPSSAQTITGQPLKLASTAPLLAANINAIRMADEFKGSDCGAKITNADADLGAVPGEIWVNTNCGTTWTSAVTISNNQHTIKIFPGSYTLNQTLLFSGNASGLVCSGGWAGSGNGFALVGPCLLKAGPATNLAALVQLTGVVDYIAGVTLDGNKSAQTTCAVAPCSVLWINHALRADVSYSIVQNGFSHGIEIDSSTVLANEAGATDIFRVQSVFNNGSAIRVVNTGDGSILETQMDSSNIGLELIDSGTWRMNKDDFGSNTLNGVKETCTQTIGTAGMTLGINQFANNGADQLFINAYSGVAQCAIAMSNVITGNQFFTPATGTPNSIDAINIQNSGHNTIAGNTIGNPNGGITYKNGIEFSQASATELADTIVGNTIFGTGTANCIFQPSALAVGNTGCNTVGIGIAAVDLTAQTGNVAASNIYAVPATGGGLYRVAIYAIITTAASVSSTLPTACVIWIDRDSGQHAQQIFNVTASGLTNASNTTSTLESGTITINAKASSNIAYAYGNSCAGGSAYASSAAGMAYAAHVRVEGW